MNPLDIAVQTYLASARTPVVTEFMYVLTTIFDLSTYFILILALGALFVYLMRGYRYAFLFAITLVIGGALIYILKSYFGVSRPLDPVVETLGKSFPSGHATIATIFFGMLMYTFDTFFKRVGRILFNSLCIVLTLLVCFSRLYLGAHWFSDVVGGIILGIVVCWVTIRVSKKRKSGE